MTCRAAVPARLGAREVPRRSRPTFLCACVFEFAFAHPRPRARAPCSPAYARARSSRAMFCFGHHMWAALIPTFGAPWSPRAWRGRGEGLCVRVRAGTRPGGHSPARPRRARAARASCGAPLWWIWWRGRAPSIALLPVPPRGTWGPRRACVGALVCVRATRGICVLPRGSIACAVFVLCLNVAGGVARARSLEVSRRVDLRVGLGRHCA